MEDIKLVKGLHSKMEGGYSNQSSVLEFLVSIMTEKQKEKVSEYCGLNKNKIDIKSINFDEFNYNCESISDFDLGNKKVTLEINDDKFKIEPSKGLMYLCKCIIFLSKIEEGDDDYDLETNQEYKEIFKFTEKLYVGLKINYCYEFSKDNNEFYFSVDSENENDEDYEDEGCWVTIKLS